MITTTQWKGISVLAAMLACTTLWFARNDAHVKAVDIAEQVAADNDRLGELAGNNSTSLLFYAREWETDYSVTNSWGGYSNIILTGSSLEAGGFRFPGTFVFWKRFYGEVHFYAYGLVGGAIDAYTNTATQQGVYRILWDCGSGGASGPTVQRASFSTKYTASCSGWWMTGDSSGSTNIDSSGKIGGFPTAGYRIPAWYPITNGMLWAFQSVNYYNPDIFNDATGQYITNNAGALPFGLTTSGLDSSRVRYYSPTTLHVYTNTMLSTFDQREIASVRSNGVFLSGVGSAPCFIGPTNSGANYDGATNFPPVSASAWRTIYTNWAFGHTVQTNVTWWTNSIPTNPPPTLTNTTVVYTNANEGIFVSTNELAWHYSALYRLRDALYSVSTQSNQFYFYQGAGSTLAGAYAAAVADFSAGHNQTAGVLSPYPYFGASYGQGWSAAALIQSDDMGSSWFHVTVLLQRSSYTLSNIYTNVPAMIEWYAHVSAPAGGSFVANGTPDTVTNCWKLVDTQTITSTQSTTTVYAPWPAFPASVPTNTYAGFVLDSIVPVIRWQQRACTQDVFDGRY